MRLVTYTSGANPAPRIGVRVGHRVLDIDSASRVDGEPLPANMRALFREGRGALSRVQALARAAQLNAGRFASALVEERAIRFLPPIPDADKFLCVGGNYRPQYPRDQQIRELSEEPTAFVKLNLSLVGHNARIARPAGVVRLDCEPELVFVIGKRALNVRKDDTQEYAVGVTLWSDLTDRDPQEHDCASKNESAFGTLGPEIVTMDEIADPYDLWLTCEVNGEERTRVNTRDQIWKLADILAHFSLPIEPGDLLSTGAPGRVALGKTNGEKLLLKPGDVVDCAIEGITSLRSTIIATEN